MTGSGHTFNQILEQQQRHAKVRMHQNALVLSHQAMILQLNLLLPLTDGKTRPPAAVL
jgi:hypothetical protein